MDFSIYAENMSNTFVETARCFQNVAFNMNRYSVLMKPKLFIDGNKWYALYGNSLQEGVSGFGDSPDEALKDFDTKMKECISFNLPYGTCGFCRNDGPITKDPDGSMCDKCWDKD